LCSRISMRKTLGALGMLVIVAGSLLSPGQPVADAAGRGCKGLPKQQHLDHPKTGEHDDYFDLNPDARGKVVLHHAIEWELINIWPHLGSEQCPASTARIMRRLSSESGGGC
jgi:hypothetical protein